MDEQRLPIKLIMPKQGAERRVRGGRGKIQPFRPVDSEYRRRLSNQISAIQKTLPDQIEKTGLAPIRVTLISKALAKTHRPERLFSDKTCPIVGAGRLGELFVKGTLEGLYQLDQVVRNGYSDQLVKELSCIESVEPITPNFRRRRVSSSDILRSCPRRNAGFVARVRLFDFADGGDQEKITDDFESACRLQGIPTEKAGYSLNSYVYAIECKNTNDLDTIAGIVGVRSIYQMPLVRIMQPKSLNRGRLPSLSVPASREEDIPVVVVVDSGVSLHVPELANWVVGGESHVAPPYQNTDHGTFVAGLICWGSELNPALDGISGDPCGVFDFQVLPNSDPAKGETESVTESEFLISLESCLKQWANKFKVWNLSLSTNAVCSIDEFSPLAEELDNLQEHYQVTFVISAGNYETPPLLDYPRDEAQQQRGRITSPADSVLGITVGSISHLDYGAAGPGTNQPSAFSRNGNGPNCVIKPDLVHYGGSCSIDLSHTTGVRSIRDEGSAEDIGTSFSTPLVSRTLAQIYHQITPTPSPVLSKALLVHHARDPRTNGRVPDGEENYFGFGRPAPVPYCLECTPHSSTLVFDDVLRPGFFLEWNDFPYPPSLKKGDRYFGEIWMTVAFAPTRGARWGTEYCETHIDAHFGVYHSQKSRKTGKETIKFRGLVPPEYKNPGVLYESMQVAQLRKWSPIRTYHGKLSENGEKGLRWRLKVRLLTRHGVEVEDSFTPQPFSVIITIADPTNKASVYDEMSRLVRNRFQSQNITIRTPARIRTRGRRDA